MNIKITKPISGGTVAAVASKSMAHRLLICAALSSGASQVRCSESSDDIDATVRCLNALGAEIGFEDGIFRVKPIPRPVLGARSLDVGESGSTLRFMLPIACALGADTTFHMGGRLPSRPLSPLYEELISHGCAISAPGWSPLHTGGRLTSGNYTIPGNISSQFISGLLLALPLLDGESLITVTGALESKPYVGMTLDALRQSGIVIRAGAQSYRISGNQSYASGRDVTVEGDWSNAAFWLCAGAIAAANCAGAMGDSNITVTNLNANSLQGDKAVLTILARFGAVIRHSSDSVAVSRGTLSGIAIDAGDTPDLVPVLAAVASVSDGETVIYNAKRLRIKESDRLRTVSETLSALGADIAERPDGLVLRGKPRLTGGTVDAHGDHRIAMTAAVAALSCDGPVTIRNAEAVGKSYPGFFRDFAALGGSIEEVG
jgi:3-phosphoshikimate 1-carboxyvinyltransferase